MILKSNYPDIKLLETDIFSFLFNRNDRPFPDSKGALVTCEGDHTYLTYCVVLFLDPDQPTRSYNYQQLKDAAARFAFGLEQDLGIKKGHVIGLVAGNDVDQPAVIFGSLACGAILSPINPAYTEAELEHQLRDSEAQAVIVDRAAFPRALKACARVGLPLDKIVLIGPQSAELSMVRHWSSIGEYLIAEKTLPLVPIDCKNDVAVLVYSSGTTGLPKGVMLTHHNITANTQQTQDFETLTWDGSQSVPNFKDATRGVGDKILAVLPFFHIYGLTAMMINPIYTGVLTVVGRSFDLKKWCTWVQEHQITIGYVVPPIVVQLSKDPIAADYDLSSLRITTCGAAPLSKQLVVAVYERLGIRIKQGYGMSETAPTLFTMRWGDWNKKSGSAGRLIPNVQAKICSINDDDTRDEDVVELEVGSTGELYVKGPNVFKGYWKREHATRESFVDGWFRTGDIGYVDMDGDLFITDRAKELIKYKGFQVAPAELEGLLLQNELVRDVAVVGVNKPELGTEVPRAYIVHRGGPAAVREGDAASIMKWLESQVVSYKRLRGGVFFLDEIPRNGSGKILRRILKDQANRALQTKL